MKSVKSFLPWVTLGLGLSLGYFGKAAVDAGDGPEASKKSLEHSLASGEKHSQSAKVQADLEHASAELASRDHKIADLQLELVRKNVELAKYQADETLPPIEDSPEERERLANEMLDLTHTKDQIEGSFSQASKILMKNEDPDKQEAMQRIFNKYYSWDQLSKGFTKIFSEVYSAEDMQKINRFYQSEEGRLMLDKQPELTMKIMTLVAEINQKNMPQMSKEFEALAKKSAGSAAQAGR